MYPEDQDRQQQPVNPNLMGEAPQPFNYEQPMQQNSWGQTMPPVQSQYAQPQQTMPPMQPMQQMAGVPPQSARKGGPGKALPWIISGILLLFVIILAVLFVVASNNSKKSGSNNGTNNNSNQNTNTTKTEECGSKLRRYQNEDLDIRFCYPTAWGDVKLGDGKLDPSDSGTRVRLSFADKSQVHLGLVSDDWSTEVGRDGTCVDPSAQAFPDTSSFSAKWVTEPATGPITSATRGLEVVPDKYLLQEHADDTLTAGVCVEGYQAFGGEVYRNAAASYYAKFTDKIATPQAHISSPTTLISVADRNDFTTFVKSIEKF